MPEAYWIHGFFCKHEEEDFTPLDRRVDNVKDCVLISSGGNFSTEVNGPTGEDSLHDHHKPLQEKNKDLEARLEWVMLAVWGLFFAMLFIIGKVYS
jgi:hypothetical protein